MHAAGWPPITRVEVAGTLYHLWCLGTTNFAQNYESLIYSVCCKCFSPRDFVVRSVLLWALFLIPYVYYVLDPGWMWSDLLSAWPMKTSIKKRFVLWECLCAVNMLEDPIRSHTLVQAHVFRSLQWFRHIKFLVQVEALHRLWNCRLSMGKSVTNQTNTTPYDRAISLLIWNR